MAIKTLYTAVGRFERRTNGCNRSCPIILLGGQEYMADMQEMVIWSMLNWRILRWDDIAQEYEKLATASGYCTERSWEDCTNRLLTRGLLVSGSGETEYGQLVTLTYHEFAVLAYLARHPGWVFSAYQIYEAIWCKDGENCGTAVASVIGQIRRKLTPDTPKGGYIRTILGSGYKFSSSPF